MDLASQVLVVLAYVALAAFAVMTLASARALHRQRTQRPFEQAFASAADMVRAYLRARTLSLYRITESWEATRRDSNTTYDEIVPLGISLRARAARELHVHEDNALLGTTRPRHEVLAEALDRVLIPPGERVRISKIAEESEKAMRHRRDHWKWELVLPYWLASLAGMAGTMAGIMTLMQGDGGVELSAAGLSFEGVRDALLTSYIGIGITILAAFMMKKSQHLSRREAHALARELESILAEREAMYAARRAVQEFLHDTGRRAA